MHHDFGRIENARNSAPDAGRMPGKQPCFRYHKVDPSINAPASECVACGQCDFHAGSSTPDDHQAIAALMTRGRHDSRPGIEKRIQRLHRQQLFARAPKVGYIGLAADIERQKIVFDRLAAIQANEMPIGIQSDNPILDHTNQTQLRQWQQIDFALPLDIMAGNPARQHARVDLKTRRRYQNGFNSARLIAAQRLEHRKMRMASPYQHQALHSGDAAATGRHIRSMAMFSGTGGHKAGKGARCG